jgi:hypothetical protein
LDERHYHPAIRLAFAIATMLLCLATIEVAMRYRDWPRPVLSGWRASQDRPGSRTGPLNQYGWRGQPEQKHHAEDFVVLLTGGAEVECLACPPDETMDVILQRALRRFNPNARVITLGSTGYGQDQQYLALHEYFAHEHADLVIDWAVPARDVPANTFRSGPERPGKLVIKPTFAYARNDLFGPTETIGKPIYRTKLSTLLRPLLIDVDRNWTILLPKPDPGAAGPPDGTQARQHVDQPLEQQRSDWSIWMTPRPARVTYGLGLTRALFRHMRELSQLRGARFALLLTPSSAGGQTETPVALEHAGHWFVADPATRDAAIAKLTDGFTTITLSPDPTGAPAGDDQGTPEANRAASEPRQGAPERVSGDAAGIREASDGNPDASPEPERRLMERLAEALNQRDLLTPPPIVRQRH